MKKIYILEMSDIYDNQVRLPYSTGLIWSHCKSYDEIKNNYDLREWFFYKEDVESIIKKIKNPDIIVYSCSIWNWNLNCNVAKRIKEKFPDVINICGGPQIPKIELFYKESESISPYWGFPLKQWFVHYNYFDIISSGEGEITIAELLIENLKKNPDFKLIPGCILKDNNNQIYLTGIRERIKNINQMPSPYLDGSFDKLLRKDFTYTATIETTRGCPFNCTFCDQGNEYFSKLSLPSLDKIKLEIEWCVKNKIFYIDNADSNFGMFYERDMEISKFLIDCKKRYGYPKYYSTAWVKGKTLNSIEIMKVLKECDLDRGANMAFQSLNSNVLKSIKRKNINDDTTKKTIESFESSNIGIYAELILGLPQETKESFLNGLYDLLESGHHKFIGVYPLQVLPNTECADFNYIKKHGLILKKTKTNSAYIVPSKNDPDDIMVVGSNTMSYEDWIDCFIQKVLVIGCHTYGPTQYISRYLNEEYQIPFKVFYSKLYEWSILKKNTILGKEMIETKKSIQKTLNKNSHWNRLLPKISNHTWIHEEALAINITINKKQFYTEIWDFVRKTFKINLEKNIMNIQYYSIVDPNIDYPIKVDNIEYNLNWNRENFKGNYSDWAKECIWWGRKSSRFMCNLKSKNEL